MENFIYNTPTKIVFGKNAIDDLATYVSQYGKKVLLTYGGGSIKKIGLYDKVKELLQDFKIFELGGIEPNPKYSTSVLDGVKSCKDNKIDVILAVGGGSVLDCSKAIAVGAKYDGETWDLIIGKALAKDALPIIDIMTIAATGSEYDSGCVISRVETKDKIGYLDEHMYPKVSIIDPTYTFSVSKRQTAAGSADAINHSLEQFFVRPNVLLNDRMIEGTIESIIKNTNICLSNPNDYNARAELFYDCTLACNGLYTNGSGYAGWPMHAIEHMLSAFYDITHGVGLAILTPRWMKHILNENTISRFVELGTCVFNIDSSLDKIEIANKTIDKFYELFESWGIPMHLKDVGIDESRVREMAHKIALEDGLDASYNYVPLKEEDIFEIIMNCL